MIKISHSDSSESKYKNISKSLTIPNIKNINEIATYLRGNFEIIQTHSDKADIIEQDIKKFTDEQVVILDNLEDNNRMLFLGGAGTGKTILAIEAFKRAVCKKERTLFLCYNIALSKWINYILKDCTNEDCIVSNFHNFMADISTTDIGSDNDKSEEFWKIDLPILSLDAIDNNKVESFDRIIIDEGQDLIFDNYLDVINGLLKGGLSGGKWQIFADFDRQSIFGNHSNNKMSELLNERTNNNYLTFKLTKNCRNTLQIINETSKISGFEKAYAIPSAIEGEKPKYYFWNDKDQQKDILENVLKTIKEKKILPNEVVILSCFNYEKSVVSMIDDKTFPIINIKNDDFISNKNKYLFSTIQAYKGLESKYVIIVDINHLDEEWFKKLLYVGMSRAKVELYMLMNSELKDYIDKIKGK